ncbi:DM13 domain-containing protein [Roseobacter ponti]|uniref:DM13 domain-containing protein n=1 Tax=Roseobacter ponti TaxID=1891787 RepID=A0A858SW41_9RHOB|nr:DM13 domain-containing protein [Roseobacter ponti]QJF52915.1 DM13 domain-containing protein [Roseobacter ponti]
MKNLISALMIVTLSALATLGAGADTTGTFTGKSNHVTTGGVTITKNADGTATVTLHDNFSLDGAPDPRVAFGKNGTYAPEADLGVLKNLTGGQSYVVPASVNLDDYDEIYIWCLKFSVPLGVAALN